MLSAISTASLIDLAFIDGMHLLEFALRDFINMEPLMADTGVRHRARRHAAPQRA